MAPASIATSLAINAVSEGIPARSAKGAKADVNTSKPKGGDVPVTKPRKDVTPVQQLALPGPTSKPLALPAPKSTPKTDFYVAPDGVTYVTGRSTVSGKAKSNLGISYDVTPSDIHGVVNINPNPIGGIPNSSLDVLDSNVGELLTRRFYDSNGKAYRDVDFTHHGNIGTHPEAPHEHFWNFLPDGKIIRK